MEILFNIEDCTAIMLKLTKHFKGGNKLRFLLFSVSIGAGHDSAAKAISEEILLRMPQAQIEIIDTFKYINPVLNRVMVESYMETLKFTPKVWGYLYEQSEHKAGIVDFGQLSNRLLSKKLENLITEFKPDVIFCTHAFPTGIISALKAKTGITIPVISTVTDYTIHRLWVHKYCDAYIIASPLLYYEAERRGIPASKIYPVGIPIKPIFAYRIDKVEVRNKLDFLNKLTLLVMGGGLGLGSIKDAVKVIEASEIDCQIVVVCGKNEKLCDKLKQSFKDNINIKIFGFVENMHELMSTADLLITKPGGLTTAEALSKGLPMIIVNPIPGQEERNTIFLCNSGVAVKVNTEEELPIILSQILENTLRIPQMKDMAKYLGKPNAVKEIVNIALSKLGG